MLNKEFIYDNKIYYIKIGKNSSDNWNIIDNSDKNDIWFHLDKFPSPHVILKFTDNINENVLIECANYCKKYSKYKNFPTKYLKVVYTNIENIKKGENIGSVIYKNTNKNNYITI